MIHKHIVHLTSFILFSILTILSSCKKDNSLDSAQHTPIITFLSPTQGQSINESDTVWIHITISSEDDLHEYSIVVKNLTEGTTAFNYGGHSHDKTASAKVYFIANVTMDADMQLTVTTMDHNSNQYSKSISFNVKNTVAAPKAVINILSPNKPEYSAGNIVSINGTINHSVVLKKVEVLLSMNGNPVIYYTPDVRGLKSYNFDTICPVTSSSHAMYFLSVTATDENNIISNKTTYFDVHP